MTDRELLTAVCNAIEQSNRSGAPEISATSITALAMRELGNVVDVGARQRLHAIAGRELRRRYDPVARALRAFR